LAPIHPPLVASSVLQSHHQITPTKGGTKLALITHNQITPGKGSMKKIPSKKAEDARYSSQTQAGYHTQVYKAHLNNAYEF
jgi:hypothetical protein